MTAPMPEKKLTEVLFTCSIFRLVSIFSQAPVLISFHSSAMLKKNKKNLVAL
jgi:hypothetical protein